MSQNDFNLANQGFPSMRSDMNSALQALASNSSGATSPATTYAYQWWYDTTTNKLKMRNAANSIWIDFATFDQATGTFTITAASVSGLPALQATVGQLSGDNIACNPCGTVNQRGYVSGTATTTANQFTLDRWFVLVSGQSLTFTGNDSRRIMTAPAGGVGQVFEGRDILGGTYVINWTGTATVTVNGTARNKGVSFTLPANTNAKVVFYSGTFTDVKCEFGAISTPIAPPNYGAELLRCQRYAWVPVRQTVIMFATVDSGSSLARVGSRDYPVQMRATPTVSYTLSYGTATSFTNSADGCEVVSNAFNSASGNNFTITLVSAELTA